jgi:hypothetical protein
MINFDKLPAGINATVAVMSEFVESDINHACYPLSIKYWMKKKEAYPCLLMLCLE